uniref:Uncharacterized protein n=1 Tax=Ananas comosus var. bracteatus TaxID=296719 RepID=A0A6V7NG33_ANACO|nr:unnamed protein product [Ananas comosus var. bracteatus]
MIPLSDSIAKRWLRLKRLASGQNLIDIDLAIAATYWELWKERNRRLFDNLQVRSDVLGRCIFETKAHENTEFDERRIDRVYVDTDPGPTLYAKRGPHPNLPPFSAVRSKMDGRNSTMGSGVWAPHNSNRGDVAPIGSHVARVLICVTWALVTRVPVGPTSDAMVRGRTMSARRREEGAISSIQKRSRGRMVNSGTPESGFRAYKYSRIERSGHKSTNPFRSSLFLLFFFYTNF